MNLEIERRKDEIKLVCLHEAGHYLMAKELKFLTGSIKVCFHRNSGHQGSSDISIWNKGQDDINKIKSFLRNRLKVLYAGVLAESINLAGDYNEEHANNEWTSGGGQMDYANIRELVRFLRDITYPFTDSSQQVQKELDAITGELIGEVGDFIQKNIQLIHGIAETLATKVVAFNLTYQLSKIELNSIPKLRELYGDKNSEV
jgi:hypothetical protein